MLNLSKAQYDVLVRHDLSAFIEKVFYQLNPSTHYYPNFHIEAIAAKLEACRQGKIRRLIINVPPRYLKSISVSVAFPAYWLGHNPAVQIMCVSYAADLAEKFSRDSRTVMQSNFFRRLFRTRLAEDRQTLQEFATTDGGYRMATSVEGGVTGRGADVIIIDDPLQPAAALSDTQRDAGNEFYDHTLYSRLNSKVEGTIIIVAQRLHENDLVGHVLSQEDWEVLSFPAIAEQDELHIIDTPYGRRRHARRIGEALHPEREPITMLEQLRRNRGEWVFAGQYQQRPAPIEGGLIQREWFNFYKPDELPDTFKQVYQSWDTANTISQLSDYSVCTTWGAKKNKLYLLHVYRERLNFPDLKQAIKRLQQTYQATVLLIEDKASGTQLIQDLIHEGVKGVTKYTPEGDKKTRMLAQTGTLASGIVYIPKEAGWLEQYLHELLVFPNGKYDDQVDSTSQILDWIKRIPPEPGILGYYRLEAKRLGIKVPGDEEYEYD